VTDGLKPANGVPPEVKHGCAATNRAGAPCAAPRLVNSQWCNVHDPARARVRAEARRRGGLNRRTPRSAPPPPPGAVAIRSVPTIQERLEGELADALKRENSDSRTRSVVALLTLALKCLEVGEVEERLAALEARISEQSNNNNLRLAR